MTKEHKRDDHDFDKTSLRASFHGANLTRDYSAHFFRWSFARRFIKATDQVIEVGCGPDRPLFRLLAMSTLVARVDKYLGVDLNKLPAWENKRGEFIGEFNFVKRWKELRDRDGFRPGGFDVAVNMEVIEHMKVEHGRELLRGLFALLRPGGALLLSTPCYDGVHHARNHIHEYEVPELTAMVTKAGFTVEHRFGTFMNTSKIGKSGLADPALLPHVKAVSAALSEYFDPDALSCFFAPLYPDNARNNLWVLRKPLRA